MLATHAFDFAGALGPTHDQRGPLGGPMELRDFFSEDAVKLELEGTTKDDVLKELIGLLGLDEKVGRHALQDAEAPREPRLHRHRPRHRDSPLPLAGRLEAARRVRPKKTAGLDFKAIDEKPVNFFFLIVAPPLEVSNQYLPVLGKIAQFSKEPDVPERLLKLKQPREFMQLLRKGAWALALTPTRSSPAASS